LEYAEANLDNFNPMWEQQLAAMTKTFSSLPIGRQFVFQYELDDQGIIYFLNGGNCKKANTGLVVSASGVGAGEATDFINRDKVRCWTQNTQYSWYCVDFGENRWIIPTYYTLGYGSSGSACCPRYWVLQATKTLPETPNEKFLNAPHNDPNWKILSAHTNDEILQSEWAVHSWKLSTKEAFRYFRILQTGPNCYVSSGDDAWSQVLVASRFEVYGTLLEIPTPVETGTTQMMTYGTGAFGTFKTPPLIRADPQVTRELQQLIMFLSRPDTEPKGEKVKVHDIIL